MNAHGEDLTAELRLLSTSDLSDSLDRLGINGQCVGIMPVGSAVDLVGRAWTLRYGPIGVDPGTVGDYIDELGDGQVVVLDNQGRLDATVWGDLLTTAAAHHGVEGTVIDGVCRDVHRTAEMAYPIHARGHWIRTGKDRVRVEAIEQPVSIGGVRVEPGDWLRGDAGGLVCVPRSRIAEVVTTALAIHEAEEAIRNMVIAGHALKVAREQHGYHALQSRVL